MSYRTIQHTCHCTAAETPTHDRPSEGSAQAEHTEWSAAFRQSHCSSPSPHIHSNRSPTPLVPNHGQACRVKTTHSPLTPLTHRLPLQPSASSGSFHPRRKHPSPCSPSTSSAPSLCYHRIEHTTSSSMVSALATMVKVVKAGWWQQSSSLGCTPRSAEPSASLTILQRHSLKQYRDNVPLHGSSVND